MTTQKITTPFEKQLFEKKCWKENLILCGIDEVGRGCLAGPVVTAAVILNPHADHKYLKDSKVLSAAQRLQAYQWLKDNSIYSISIINSDIIDKINIYQATLYAMKRSLVQLSSKIGRYPDITIVDAMPLTVDNITINYFNFGESHSSSIAAASIIAKITRDDIMKRLDSFFPSYGFISHKGYGTKAHRQALQDGGESIIHRKTFLKKIIASSK